MTLDLLIHICLLDKFENEIKTRMVVVAIFNEETE